MSCRCWDCLRSRGVRAIAPRLARAYDQRKQRRRLLVGARAKLSRAERNLAHRELQLIRAGHVGDRRYVQRRSDKLERAQQEVAHLRARVEELAT